MCMVTRLTEILPKYWNTCEKYRNTFERHLLKTPILPLINYEIIEILCQHRKRESIVTANNLQAIFEVLSLKTLLSLFIILSEYPRKT